MCPFERNVADGYTPLTLCFHVIFGDDRIAEVLRMALQSTRERVQKRHIVVLSRIMVGSSRRLGAASDVKRPLLRVGSSDGLGEYG